MKRYWLSLLLGFLFLAGKAELGDATVNGLNTTVQKTQKSTLPVKPAAELNNGKAITLISQLNLLAPLSIYAIPGARQCFKIVPGPGNPLFALAPCALTGSVSNILPITDKILATFNLSSLNVIPTAGFANGIYFAGIRSANHNRG